MYYFSYGSFLDLNYLSTILKTNDIIKIDNAYCKNNKFSYKRLKRYKYSKANIEPRKGSKIYGVVYFIPPNINLSNLIKTEKGYKLIDISCILSSKNKEIKCQTFQMIDGNNLDTGYPSISYYNHIVKGYKEHKLPSGII